MGKEGKIDSYTTRKITEILILFKSLDILILFSTVYYIIFKIVQNK